jgi:hypothetical protein
MKVIDVLEIFDEDYCLSIRSSDNEKCLAFYDGKNSIDDEYNECEVTDMWPDITMCRRTGNLEPCLFICIK